MSEIDRCEAKVSYRIIQQGQTDGLYDLYGKRISLPEGQEETPTVEEATIACARCNLSKVFNAQGIGFAAYNEAARQVKAYLRQNCGKWKEKLERGEVKGEMPEKLLP